MSRTQLSNAATLRFTNDGEHFDEVMIAVTEAVARERDTDPLELTPLYEIIDPEALDRLFQRSPARQGFDELRVTFEYEGCEVAVGGGGWVSVRPLDDVDR